MISFFRLIFAGVLLTAAGLGSVVAQDQPAPGQATTDQPPTDQPAKADAITFKPTARMITLSDFGAEDLAYLAVPASPPTLGIVLVPDAFGLDDFTKAEAFRLAGLGYLVVAVDIYNGHVLADSTGVSDVVSNLSSDSVMKTVNAGIRLFHESPKFRVDHVVAMGWGTGANYVLQAARESKSLDGAITFYGPVPSGSDIGKFATPLCAVYPQDDPIATHDRVLAFQKAMKDAGNDCSSWFIAAKPGWSSPKSGNFNPVEDQEAWKVALPFIARIGAEPVKAKGSVLDKAKNSIDKAADQLKNLFK